MSGRLVEGQWVTQKQFANNKGRFVRSKTAFRGWITSDGSTPFAPEAGRYHLYVSHACPWAHRTMIVRALRGLTDVISVSVVDPLMLDDGWIFSEGPGCIPDPEGAEFLREVYLRADPKCTGRVTVPILWDKKTGTIVNNESIEIVRMLDTVFMGLGDPEVCFYPEPLRDQIDATIEAIYEPINNGVYKSGFAAVQEAYEEAVGALFDALDHWDGVLADRRYLCGDVITEADWCLFTTLARFDPVYVSHFKCNLRRIADYPNLSGYLRELYQVPGVAETCHFDHIKGHYYRSHLSVNPKGIVPMGPIMDLDAPHGRGGL